MCAHGNQSIFKSVERFCIFIPVQLWLYFEKLAYFLVQVGQENNIFSPKKKNEALFKSCKCIASAWKMLLSVLLVKYKILFCIYLKVTLFVLVAVCTVVVRIPSRKPKKKAKAPASISGKDVQGAVPTDYRHNGVLGYGGYTTPYYYNGYSSGNPSYGYGYYGQCNGLQLYSAL